jgi:hypothetical protein
MPAVAVTDHGRCGELLKLKKECTKAGIKYIPGMEAYVAPTDHQLKEKIDGHNKTSYHLTLLAKSHEGLKNIFRLSSTAWIDGFYYKPRIDFELLQRHSEGLVVLSGCAAGRAGIKILEGDVEAARQYLIDYRSIFKDDFYVEVQNHNLPWQAELNEELFKLSHELSIPYVITQDSHYLNQEDAELHKYVTKIAAGDLEFLTDQVWFKSREEMELMFDEKHHHALDRTVEIANKCNCQWETGKTIWPVYPLPENKTPEQELRELAWEGFKEKFGGGTKEYTDRLNYELDVIVKMGFPTYFLVVQDFINWAKRQKIGCGPGRGCLVGETNVITSDGMIKELKNITINDNVFNKNGEVDTVRNCFEYPIDEELVRLETYCGDFEGITLTKDHVVFGAKAEYVKNYGNWSNSTKKSHKKYKDLSGEVKEIEADKLNIGDWIVTPKINIAEKALSETIDLSIYMDSNKYNCFIENGIINESVPTNKEFVGSVRDIYRQTKIARNVIKGFRENLIPKKKNTRQERSRKVIEEYILSNFLSLENWRKESQEKKFDISTVSRFIKLDTDFFWILGKWVADGWFNSASNRVWGICFNSENELEQIKRTKEWLTKNNIKFNEYRHATKKLLQIDVRSGIFYSWWSSLFPNYKFTSQTKEFPNFVFSLPEKDLESTLAGYLAGDSGAEQGRIKITTTSRVLAYQTKSNFLRLGIPCSVRYEERKDNRSNFPDITYSYYLNVPVVGFIKELCPEFSMIKSNHWAKIGNNIFCKIRKKEYVSGVKKVYDISVENHPSYLTASGAVHNSSAGSLVAYCLGITEVDPIKYSLIFERFLNPGRIDSPPDVDVDMDALRRDEVIDYVKSRYGIDHVSNIGTASVFKPRGSIRAFARVMGYEDHVAAKLANMIPPDMAGKTATFAESITAEPKLLAPATRPLIDMAMKAEGIKQQVGVHAAGVIVSDKPMTDYLPLYVGRNGKIAAQFDMGEVEEIGLVKFDFLGLKNLGVIQETVDLIKRHHGIDIDPTQIEDGDEKTYNTIFKTGNLDGVFQFETSSGFKDLCIKIEPKNIEDLSIITSLYRPGPLALKLTDRYIECRKGKEPEYFLPELEPILSSTLGLIIYQEQIMKICTDIAGYTLSEADTMRKVLGKKLAEKMKQERGRFVSGCEDNGMDSKKAEELFDMLDGFSSYSFNSCLPGRTEIISSDNGIMTIDEINENLRAKEKVFLKSFDIEKNEIINDECIAVIDEGVQDVYEFILSDEQTIECTLQHKFLCSDFKMHTVKEIVELDLDILSCDSI